MRYAGDRSWPTAALMVLPRWPCLVPLGALWAWALLSRRVVAIATQLASAGVALFAIMGFHYSFSSPAPDRGDLRILTCNVHRRQLDAEAMLALLEAIRPDIVAFQDWTSAHEKVLFSTESWHVRRLGELMVASVYPIVDAMPIDLQLDPSLKPSDQGEAALFTLETPHGVVTIINLHLASPHGGLIAISKDGGEALATNVQRRWLESDLIRARAKEVVGPLLVLGDFNTTPESPLAIEHWADFTDTFTHCGSGFGYTYYNNRTQLRIDRVLAGHSLAPVRCQVGPPVGSPHRPVVVDFRSNP